MNEACGQVEAAGLKPALDASTAAWATLVMGDATADPAGTPAFERALAVLAFVEADGAR